jgi:DNA topoisomerase-2
MCTLHITEGKSAKTFAIAGVSSLPEEQRDYHGFFAIRGKFINVLKSTLNKVNNNKEVKALREILNIVPGKDYTKDENYHSLRYGKIDAFSDADDDGIHIKGLILNFIHEEMKGFISRKGALSYSTAVVSVRLKNKKRLLFYTNPDFRKWYQTNIDAIAENGIKYYKGLGSIKADDAPLYFQDPKIIRYTCDGQEKQYMELGFGTGKDAANDRKSWITKDLFCNDLPTCIDDCKKKDVSCELVSQNVLAYEGDLSLSTFVDKYLVIYSQTALRRALPCLWDGLKVSQRKVLFGIIKKRYKTTKELPVIAGIIKASTKYHHGEASLYDVIIKMGQGFVGSNNIPLLQNDGNFGSRLAGGEDASSARYLSTNIEDIVHTIFPAADECLLDQLIEDGNKIEYKHFMPVIPMLLVNGSEGIATGFSTSIPCYNPLDLVKWIELWLSDETNSKHMPVLKPWYRGFKGELSLTSNGRGWLSKGILEKGTGKDKTWWHIKELPIGLWTDDFNKWLDYLETGTAPEGKSWKKCDVKVIDDIKRYSTLNTVHIKIKPSKHFTPDMDTVGNLKNMQKGGTFNNMVVLDEHDYPHQFKNPEDILRCFCFKRLYYYRLRRKRLLKDLKADYIKTKNKLKFVTAVVEKQLDLNQDESTLDDVLENEWNLQKLPNNKGDSNYDYLLNMKMRSMTTNKIEILSSELVKNNQNFESVKNTSAKEMWTADLDDFKKAYNTFLKTRVEEVKIR